MVGWVGTDRTHVCVELTEEAKATGLAVALPQSVALARPARLELTTFRSAT